MDFNSARFPLDLLSFYLDMSSEDIIEENTLQLPSTAENEQPANSNQVVTSVTPSSVQESPRPVAKHLPLVLPLKKVSAIMLNESSKRWASNLRCKSFLPQMPRKRPYPQLQKSQKRPSLTPSSNPSLPLKVS